MEVRNCKGCGRLFNYLHGQQLCPSCLSDLEDKFQSVKEFLRVNPKAPLNEITEENDVSVKQIKQWVREERLTFTEESQITLECEMCGGKVLSGRFCDKCKASLQHELSGAMRRHESPKKEQKAMTSSKDRMRFLDS